MPARAPTSYKAVFAALLGRCPPALPFQEPWDFLDHGPDTYGPVGEPGPGLAALREQFGDDRLVAAGVAHVGPAGDLALVPALIDPAAVTVALRAAPGLAPFALLTADGCLPAGYSPILAARRDAWTAGRIREAGVLLAAADVTEVALLRAVGLPATLADDPARLTLDTLRGLDALFKPAAGFPADNPAYADAIRADLEAFRAQEAERRAREAAQAADGEPAPAAGPAAQNGPPATPAPKTPPDADPDGRPSLALWAFSVRHLSDECAPRLVELARRLIEASTHVPDLQLAGVHHVAPDDDVLTALSCAARLRSAPLAGDLLRDHALGLRDLDALAEGPFQPPGYAEARAAFAAAMARDGSGASLRRDAAESAYREAVERDLVGPLRQAAVACVDPVERVVRTELAEVAAAMLQLSPYAMHLVTRQVFPGRLDLAPPEVEILGQHARLVDRYGRLTRDVDRLRSRGWRL